MYEQINVFITRRDEYAVQAIKEVIRGKCKNYTIFLTDAYLRLDNRSLPTKADLSIVIAHGSPHDRYGSEVNWFKTVAKNIYTNSTVVVGIIDDKGEKWIEMDRISRTAS